MKIIGKTADGFICEASEGETRAVLGLNATSDDVKKLTVGNEITFSKALHNLSLLRDVRNSNTYNALEKAKLLQNEINSVVTKLQAIDSAADQLRDQIKKEEV